MGVERKIPRTRRNKEIPWFCIRKVWFKKGYKLSNADITILLQEPKISKYKVKITEVLSGILNVDHSKISVKATTTEGLGFVGREEGVAAHCVVIMEVL